ncbi:hypothetical protein OQA88_12586 [Cercophora sp. LCS_1]
MTVSTPRLLAALLTFPAGFSLPDMAMDASATTENIAGRGTKINGCSILVQAGLGDLLYFPSDGEYNTTISSYYAKDVQDVKPACVLKPQTSRQAAQAIKALNTKTGRTFPVAIRSGGHAPYASNNVKDGVTIDLGRLNSVEFNKGKDGDGTVLVGAGARWSQVYSTLEAQGAMVAGAREGHVGVGGFLLGGGISWYSGKRGLCADNIVRYEVILASGDIVHATATKNSDLFRALKGGLNNLGLVTEFEIKTFTSRDVFGGVMVFPWTQKDSIVANFVQMVDGNRENPADTGFIAFTWSPTTPSPSIAYVTANIDGVQNSTTWTELGNLSPLVDFRAKMPLTGLTAQVVGELGLYNTWYTLSFHNTPDMARYVVETFKKVTQELELQGQIDEEVRFIFVLSPLPKTFTEKSGGSILGLDKLATNSIVLQPEAILPSQKYQPLVQQKLKEATDAIESYAKKTGQNIDFRYINYANPEQNPLASYGAENGKFLVKTTKKYDPSGYFQTSVVGEFKLSDLA